MLLFRAERTMKQQSWHHDGCRVILICIAAVFFFVAITGVGESSQRIIRVGYVDVPGYLTEEPDGHYSGYAYEYLRMLGVYGDWQYEFIAGTRNECVQRLMNGEIDLLPGVLDTAYQRARFDLVAHSMGDTTLLLAARNGVGTLQTGKNLRMGYMPEIYDGMDPGLRTFARSEGMTFQLENYGYERALMSDFEDEKLDGFITESMGMRTNVPLVGAFRNAPAYLAVRKGNTALLQELEMAADQMHLAIPNLSQTLFDKYFKTGQGAPLLLTREEREYLAQHRVIRLLASPAQRPYTYFENGEHKGIIDKIMEQMARDLGVCIETVDMPTNMAMFEALKAGQVDMIADIYSDFYWADEHNVNLTIPYLRLEYVAVTRKLGSLPEKPRVACVRGHYYTHMFVERMYPADQRIYFDKVEDCLRAVSDGRADVTYTKAVTAQSDLWKGDYYDLATNGTVVFSHEVAIGVNKQADPILVRILNKEISHFVHQRVQDIVSKELFSTKAEVSPAFVIYNYPVQIMLLLLALLIIGAMSYHMRVRHAHLRYMRRLAYEDIPTGLHNRHWFEKEAAKMLQAIPVEGKEGRLAVVIFSISRADRLIKSYGNELITEKLKNLAQGLADSSPWAMLVAANSSGVRIYCLAYLANEQRLEDCVQEVIAAHDMFVFHGMRIRLKLKAGGCFITSRKIALEQLVNCADTACNELHGTNEQLRFFDHQLQDELDMQQKIEAYMEKALKEEEFEVWYQPKYDIRTQKCNGAEALVRWNSKELGFLMPGQFIPVFERNGFILPFDFYMLEAVCRMQKSRQRAGQRIVPVSVNQSRLHMTEKSYLEHMRDVARRYHLPRGMIELELTETAFTDIEKYEAGVEMIHSLQDMGFSISMDDFGSGYSSLTLLGQLPMNIMKIDRSLLESSESSPRRQIILEDAISLGHKLDMKVICEGIETREQEELLLKLGCRYGQGYLFAKPMPGEAFEELLRKVDNEE